MSPDAEKKIAALQPHTRDKFRALVELAEGSGYSPYVIAGRLGCSEQAAKGTVVPCRSWHTFGQAIDLELHSPPGSEPRSAYDDMGAFWVSIGGTWGGEWVESYPDGLTGFPELGPGDPVHFQWAPTVSPPKALCDGTCADAVRQWETVLAAARLESETSLSQAILMGGAFIGAGAAGVFLIRRYE